MASGAAWSSGGLGMRRFSDRLRNDSGLWKDSVGTSGVTSSGASHAAVSCSTRGARYQHRSETRVKR